MALDNLISIYEAIKYFLVTIHIFITYMVMDDDKTSSQRTQTATVHCNTLKDLAVFKLVATRDKH